jgi:hypothetical protein
MWFDDNSLTYYIMHKTLLQFIRLVAIVIVCGWAVLLVRSGKLQGMFGRGTAALSSTTTAKSASGTVYVPNSAWSDLALETLTAHGLLYAKGGMFAVGWVGGSSVPEYLSATQWVLSTDIVSYLEQSNDKAAAVDTLLGQLQYYRDVGDTHKDTLQSVISENTEEYTRCTKEKTSADTAFYTALRAGDGAQVHQSIEDAKTSWVCQTQARVMLNAYKAMQERTIAVYTNMWNLSILLQQNRDNIVNHFDLFAWTSLEKLIVIRNALRTQKFTVVE